MIFHHQTSHLLRVLRFLSLFSILVPDGSRLRGENFTFECNQKNNHRRRDRVTTQGMEPHRREKWRGNIHYWTLTDVLATLVNQRIRGIALSSVRFKQDWATSYTTRASMSVLQHVISGACDVPWPARSPPWD